MGIVNPGNRRLCPKHGVLNKTIAGLFAIPLNSRLLYGQFDKLHRSCQPESPALGVGQEDF